MDRIGADLTLSKAVEQALGWVAIKIGLDDMVVN